MQTKGLPKHSVGSMKNGIWLVFDIDKQTMIKYWASSFSGKEKIFINNALILEQRSWTIQKETVFHSAEGDEYKLTHKLLNMKVPEYRLYRNNVLVGHYKVVINVFKLRPISLKSVLLWFLGLFVSALIILMVANFMIIKYNVHPYTDEVLAVLCGILFLLLFFRSRRIKTSTHLIIDLLKEANT
ncbi:MAG: hypothetical protein N4A35_15755 [Flavobacteriales bacterium]|nr:hypothetical protein [Flavobacteriales bacterium]